MLVRWSRAAKAMAVAVVALIALQALPSLLKPPEPPPLAPDVGLPRVVSTAPPREAEPELHQQMHPAEAEVDAVRKRPHGKAGLNAATAVIDSGPRRHRKRRRRDRQATPSPAPPP